MPGHRLATKSRSAWLLFWQIENHLGPLMYYYIICCYYIIVVLCWLYIIVLLLHFDYILFYYYYILSTYYYIIYCLLIYWLIFVHFFREGPRASLSNDYAIWSDILRVQSASCKFIINPVCRPKKHKLIGPFIFLPEILNFSLDSLVGLLYGFWYGFTIKKSPTL